MGMIVGCYRCLVCILDIIYMVSHPMAYHILRSSFANTSWLLITSSQCQWSVVFQKTETELVVRDGQSNFMHNASSHM